jgi:hypothetical protein
MRLMAFAMTTTVTTVTSGARSGERTTYSVLAKGNRKNSIETPMSERRLPAKTWPASLAGGETSRKSSSAPTTNITPAASTSPNGSDESSNISRNCGIRDATIIARRKPRNMAAPPNEGVGRSCTLRGPGTDTAPTRTDSRRTTNVRRNVLTAATASTTL